MRAAILLVAAMGLAACAAAGTPTPADPRPRSLNPADRAPSPVEKIAQPAPPPPADLQIAAPPRGDGAPPAPPAQIAASGSPCAKDQRVLACLRAPIASPNPIALALATSGAEIAVAWVAAPAAGKKGDLAYVARFRADLTAVAEVAHPIAGGATGVAIAAIPQGGWMIAVTTDKGLEVHPLGPDGSARGPAVPILSRAQSLSAPKLLGRPDGAPLLVWSGWDTRAITEAALLDEAGHERARIPVFNDVVEPHLTNGAFAGDGFLVAGRVGNTGTILRVELDGRAGRVTAPVGAPNEYHQIAWTGTGARMTYCDFSGDPTVRWVSLDRSGVIAAGPVILSQAPRHYDPAPLVAIGEDSLVLLGGHTGITGAASRLDLVRLDRQGRALGKPWTLSSEGSPRITEYRVSTLGNNVAVAWLDGAFQPGSPAGAVNLAVVAPSP